MSKTDASRTQEQRRNEAEQQLLKAAAALIAEKGPANVTLASIGERAGYSRGLATHHFGSKPALMRRLVDTVTRQFIDEITAAAKSGSPGDQLRALVRTYLRAVDNLTPMGRARLVLWADAIAADASGARATMLAADRFFRNQVARTIEAGVTSGEIARGVHAAGLAAVIVAMLRGVAFQRLLDEDVDLDACRREIEALLSVRLAVEPRTSSRHKTARTRRRP